MKKIGQIILGIIGFIFIVWITWVIIDCWFLSDCSPNTDNIPPSETYDGLL